MAGPIGIFPYTKVIFYMYKHQIDRYTERKKLLNKELHFLKILLKSIKKPRNSQTITLTPVQNSPKGNLPFSITPKIVKFTKKGEKKLRFPYMISTYHPVNIPHGFIRSTKKINKIY